MDPHLEKSRIIVETSWRLALMVVIVSLEASNHLVIRPAFLTRWWPTLTAGRVALDSTGLAILAAFWILAGAAVRAIFFRRPFFMLVLLRTIALAAGSAAVFTSYRLVMSIAHGRWSMESAMSVVSVFSLAMYCCWRWVSLLLLVIEDSGAWRDGWRRFADSGLRLGLDAATNSTLKWFFLALTAIPSIWLWQRGWHNTAVGVAALPVTVSGYFAVELHERIRQGAIHQVSD